MRSLPADIHMLHHSLCLRILTKGRNLDTAAEALTHLRQTDLGLRLADMNVLGVEKGSPDRPA